MGTFEITRNISLDLAIVVPKGEFNYEELLNLINLYYSGSVTRLLLWDCREADFSKIKTEELKKVAQVVKNKSRLRESGKTALVFSTELMFGLGRMYASFSELEGVHTPYMSFRDIEAAKEWLMK